MSPHATIEAPAMGLGPLDGTLLLGALIGIAVLLVWFPPPVSGLLRRVLARLPLAPRGTPVQRQNSTL